MHITRTTIGEAHEAIVKYILENGEYIKTQPDQYGKQEETLELPLDDPLMVTILEPFSEPRVSKANKFGPLAMKAYIDDVCYTTKRRYGNTDAAYTYGNRLRDHPILELGSVIYGNGDGKGIDQTDKIADMLVANPETRRAIAHTWEILIDLGAMESPCLQTCQFFIRNKVLYLICYFRSNDMLSAWGENAYALAELMKVMKYLLYRRGLEISIGTLTTISASAHMYHIRDAEELKGFRRLIGV